MQIPSREHESRTIPARFAALFAAIALSLCCTLPLAACESGSFSGAQTSNPAAVQIADIPEYSGALCIDVNNSEPGFTDDDFKRGAFMEFSDLDFEGRCGAAFARIGTDTLSNAPRGDISQVHPSGWEQHRYDFVDQEMLYNRSHLIAHQLCGEDANEKNLITGTRTMNSVGMTYYENIVANYVKQTGNHVLYRVTPIFAANDLVARGVQMEAESIEDGGQAVRFNVFVYNVEPGVESITSRAKVGSRATCHMWRPVARQPLPARARRRTRPAKKPTTHLPKAPMGTLAQSARIIRPRRAMPKTANPTGQTTQPVRATQRIPATARVSRKVQPPHMGHKNTCSTPRA